jgi:hypothetical protein
MLKGERGTMGGTVQLEKEWTQSMNQRAILELKSGARLLVMDSE